MVCHVGFGGGLEFAFLAGLHDRSAANCRSVIASPPWRKERHPVRTGLERWARDRGEAMLEVLLAHPVHRAVPRRASSSRTTSAHPAPPPHRSTPWRRRTCETGGDVGAMLQTILLSLQRHLQPHRPAGKQGDGPVRIRACACVVSAAGTTPGTWPRCLMPCRRLPMERSTPGRLPRGGGRLVRLEQHAATLAIRRAGGRLRSAGSCSTARRAAAAPSEEPRTGTRRVIDYLAVRLLRPPPLATTPTTTALEGPRGRPSAT